MDNGNFKVRIGRVGIVQDDVGRGVVRLLVQEREEGRAGAAAPFLKKENIDDDNG